ncbi:MAG: 4Fe-4S binding protein [Proteobacteria bacterium]|nr:4Fe-4S binding protein [Pseudomonadota bacterium]
MFPENIVEEPVTYHLIADYGVRVNILRAIIDPGKQGQMVVELSGEEIQISQGLNYLENVGVLVTPLAQKIRHLEDRCAGCTSCVPHCPTQALDVDRDSWKVSFDPEKCIVCFSCLEVCIYKAMSVEEQFA